MPELDFTAAFNSYLFFYVLSVIAPYKLVFISFNDYDSIKSVYLDVSLDHSKLTRPSPFLLRQTTSPESKIPL